MLHVNRGRWTFAIAAALVCAVLSTAPIAGAATPEETLIKQGLELRRAGRDGDALPKFEQAYSISKSPRAAAQWGLCLQAMSRWSEADPLLGEALSALQDNWVKKNRDTLKDSQEAVKAHLGRLQIIGSPDGAQVTVGGVNVGKLPLPDAVTVNEGVVDVEVSAEGHKPMTRTVSAPGASYQRIVIRLQRESETSGLPTASTDNADLSAVSAKAGSDVADESSRSWLHSPWFWAGAAVVVAAGVVVAIALSQSSSSNPYAADRTIP